MCRCSLIPSSRSSIINSETRSPPFLFTGQLCGFQSDNLSRINPEWVGHFSFFLLLLPSLLLLMWPKIHCCIWADTFLSINWGEFYSVFLRHKLNCWLSLDPNHLQSKLSLNLEAWCETFYPGQPSYFILQDIHGLLLIVKRNQATEISFFSISVELSKQTRGVSSLTKWHFHYERGSSFRVMLWPKRFLRLLPFQFPPQLKEGENCQKYIFITCF